METDCGTIDPPRTHFTTRHSAPAAIMPAKKRCQFQADQPCSSAVLRLVGQCPHCRSEFCGQVRTTRIHAPVSYR